MVRQDGDSFPHNALQLHHRHLISLLCKVALHSLKRISWMNIFHNAPLYGSLLCRHRDLLKQKYIGVNKYIYLYFYVFIDSCMFYF